MNALFVILGATGDLTKRKLIPAIYELVSNKKLDKFAVLGVARSKKSTKALLNESKKFIGKTDPKVMKKLEGALYYQQLDFYNKDGYSQLSKKITEIEKEHSLTNRLFYLATRPDHFDTITLNLKVSGATQARGWSRVCYEKPFGWDLKSSRRLEKCVLRIFNEDQIYRIDHFLGKELIANIALVRFTNRILEPIWNKDNVESVNIVLNEELGLEGRTFYDDYGALKDVVQNHMLQIMALIAMEAPKSLTEKHIRDEKAKVLKKIKVGQVVLGQYEGYPKELGKPSKTETFAQLKLSIDNPRWKGVPFYLKTGKKLNESKVGAHLRFKRPICLLDQCGYENNYLGIHISPDDGIDMHLNAKIPEKNEVAPVRMVFCHSCIYGANTPTAYETLFFDVIKGDQSSFVRSDEVEYSWRIVDSIKKGKVYTYKQGSGGPKEALAMDNKLGVKWEWK